ncbi:MAG: hypothetical protein JOZ60_13655 [Verrucomicrobia bacterium]|nr:hypothetical protein [Verrucomicrobiota bacterium]
MHATSMEEPKSRPVATSEVKIGSPWDRRAEWLLPRCADSGSCCRNTAMMVVSQMPAPAKRRSEASRFPLVPQQTERLGVPDLAILWQDSCLGYREGLPNDDEII